MSPRPLELRRASSLDELRPVWDELARQTGNPFLTWEWAAAWWRVFGDDRELLLFAAVDPADGRVVAILPLYRARVGPAQLLRFVGHGPADELGPVCAPGDQAAALEALGRVLPRRTLLLAERLPRAVVAAGRFGGRAAAAPVRIEPTPVLPVEGRTWDEWLKTKSSHFRAQVRRLERKLGREHELVMRVTEDAARFDADFDTFLRLHEARWEAAEGTSVAFAGRRLPFHREFARLALERGWLRLWIADVNGVPAAASYCLRYGGVDWCYQVGRDPAWDHYRVGFVLLARTIRSSFDDGCREFRFGLGGETYKDRFAERDPEIVTLAVGPTLMVRLSTSIVDVTKRLPPGLRRGLARRAA